MAFPANQNSEILHILLQRALTLKDRYEKGEISLLNENLTEFFESLKANIHPDELESSIYVLGSGTDILTDKLIEVNRFIHQLIEKEQLIQFLKSQPSDELLGQYLTKNWRTPFLLSHLNVPFLDIAYQQLVLKEKTPRKHRIISIDENANKTHDQICLEIVDPYENQMLEFLNSIKPKLPCNYSELFLDAKTSDQYFGSFSYFLHLLSKGFLTYDKKTNQILSADKNPPECDKNDQ